MGKPIARRDVVRGCRLHLEVATEAERPEAATAHAAKDHGVAEVTPERREGEHTQRPVHRWLRESHGESPLTASISSRRADGTERKD
jgi:hypothetical protein